MGSQDIPKEAWYGQRGCPPPGRFPAGYASPAESYQQPSARMMTEVSSIIVDGVKRSMRSYMLPVIMPLWVFHRTAISSPSRATLASDCSHGSSTTEGAFILVSKQSYKVISDSVGAQELKAAHCLRLPRHGD